MAIIIHGDNKGIAVDGDLTIEHLDFEFGRGVRSASGMKERTECQYEECPTSEGKEGSENGGMDEQLANLMKDSFADDDFADAAVEKQEIESNETIDNQSIEELQCTLSKEKIALCNFKIHKEIWLAIIEEHEKELKAHKALWVSVYCVLLKYKVIEDNKRQFCLMMNSLFEVKIDESNLGKDVDKFQNKEYKEWDVNKKSARKKDLAIEMDKRFKNYIQSKRDVIMKTLE